jgi:hypothetical protein
MKNTERIILRLSAELTEKLQQVADKKAKH